MTITEFSNEFDVLYNNISSNNAPNLDEYEKSVFLTKAQDEIINNYFNPKGNKYQEGYDGSQKRQIDFKALTNVVKLKKLPCESAVKLDHRSKLYEVPKKVLFIINESANGINNGVEKILNIKPLTFEEYNALMIKPYKLPIKNQAWRLINSSSDNIFELITDHNVFVKEYVFRYVRKPNPIILTNLSNAFGGEGLSIEGETTAQTCELDESVHLEILNRAVELAKAHYQGDLNSVLELGKRAE